MRGQLHRAAMFYRYTWLFSLFINLALLLSPLYMTQVYDRVLTSRSVPTLVALTIGVGVGYLLYTSLEALRSRLLVQAGLALDELLSGRVMPLSFSRAAKQCGVRHGAALRDVATVRHFLTGNSLFAFLDAPWGLAFLAIIFLVHWVLGLVAAIGMALLLLLTFWDNRRTQPLLHYSADQSRASARQMDAALRNAETVRAMGMVGAVVTRWQEAHRLALRSQAAASNHGGLALAVSKGGRMLLQSVMLATGAYLVIADNLSSGVMLAATILLGKATAPIEQLIAGWKGFVDARAAYDRLDQLLREGQEQAEGMPLPAPTGALAITNLTYGGAGGVPPILQGVSLEVAPGECLALIGPSGSGKSTLMKVMLGIWPAAAGTVRWDGFDIGQWSPDALGAHIGYLPQDVELFDGTVAENIARLQDAAVHAEAIIDAARRAGAHEMIQHLPRGYETPLGPGGMALSGGQRQLIGLARALFANPKVIALDEPNASLDAPGEQALVKAMATLKQAGVTLVFVTHKPALLACADKVLVLNAGRVRGFGPKEAIMSALTQQRAVDDGA